MKARGGLLLGVLLAMSPWAWAQTSVTPLTGMPALASFEASEFDAIDRSNLNVSFAVPIAHFPGRNGLDFDFAISYSSLVWKVENNAWVPVTDKKGAVPKWGWSMGGQWAGTVSFNKTSGVCYIEGPCYYDQNGQLLYCEQTPKSYVSYTDYQFKAANGTVIRFPQVGRT